MLTETLSFIYQQPWLTREVIVDWKLANVMPTCKRGWKENPGNYRVVSPISLLGKVMEQLTLSGIKRHVLDNQGLRARQCVGL